MKQYEEVTNRIIAQLEQGIVPWVQPWISSLPRNAISNRPYSGINVLILWTQPYTDNRWLTFKQVNQLGGYVLKGQKATVIFFASKTKDKKSEDPDKMIFFLKPYFIFNITQTSLTLTNSSATDFPCQINPHVDTLIANSKADFRIGGEKAFYVPSQDFICVPPQHAFHEPIDWHRTALHELGHWTGHPSRCDRDFSNSPEARAREELIAELTSAFTCAALAIVPTVRHADYIGSWLKILQNDKKAIFKAAKFATKASDYLLQFSAEHADDASC